MVNDFKEKVIGYTLEYIYGGGYYKIENLPDPENNQILDIYIIIEDVKKHDDIYYLKELYSGTHEVIEARRPTI
jgi:hypothetical protein